MNNYVTSKLVTTAMVDEVLCLSFIDETGNTITIFMKEEDTEAVTDAFLDFYDALDERELED